LMQQRFFQFDVFMLYIKFKLAKGVETKSPAKAGLEIFSLMY
jgi:hypothetical protein